MSEEHVLVIPESVIKAIGVIDGFERDTDRFLQPILSSDQLSYRPRSTMEKDPSYKQLIPYVVMQWTDENEDVKCFTYTRGGGSGESRLRAKRSIGVGGHISQEDAAETHADAYRAGMERELREEVQIGARYTQSTEGLIYDPSNEVGRVHLGVLHRFVLERPDVTSKEAVLAEGSFVSVEQLLEEREHLETWSQIALDALFATATG